MLSLAVMGLSPQELLLSGVAASDTNRIRQALAIGARIMRADERGMFPLHRAVFGEADCRPEVISLLLQAGAVVDQLDRHHRSALWLAVERGHSQSAQALINAGADVRQTRSETRLADLAAQEEMWPMLRLLKDAGASVSREQFLALRSWEQHPAAPKNPVASAPPRPADPPQQTLDQVRRQVLDYFLAAYPQDLSPNELLGIDPNEYDQDPVPFYEALLEAFELQPSSGSIYPEMLGTLSETIAFIAAKKAAAR